MGGQRHAPAALPPGRGTVPIVQEEGWAPGPVWARRENVTLAGIQTPNRPAPLASRYTD